MKRNKAISGNNMARDILVLLSEQFPPGWGVSSRLASAKGGWRPDFLLEVIGPDGQKGTFVVETKRQLEPKDVAILAERMGLYLRQLGKSANPLLLAPFLSEGTRKRLEAAGIGYADRTGNMRIVSSCPALYVRTQGADKDPDRRKRPARSLKGPKAGRIVRSLCDGRPPFGIRSLAERTGIDPGYVSRVIAFLESQDLIKRERRGPITEVRWRELVQRWAAGYSFLGSNRVLSFLDPRDVTKVPKKLASSGIRHALTGSAAAATVAPVSPTRLLMAYVEDPEQTAGQLGLTPAESGANVLLAEPFDEVVFERGSKRDSIRYAALPQVAADLLTAPGRGPSEAQALLDWMEANERSWRA